MRKVLLADDEAHIREGIAEGIDWNGMDLELVALARNGKEALELAATHRPDIVLFDIHMPYMSGLQFAKYAKQLLPDCIMIVFSGYDEFQYAQEALRLGVKQYLLKPVAPRELVEALQAAQDELSLRELQRREITDLRHRLDVSVPVMREMAIRDGLHRVATANELRQRAEWMSLEWPSNKFAVVAVEVGSYLTHFGAVAGAMTASDKEEEEHGISNVPLTLFAVKNIAEELLSSIGLCICYIESKRLLEALVCLNVSVAGHAGSELNRLVREAAGQTEAKLHDLLRLQVRAAAGNVYTELEQIPISLREALSRLQASAVPATPAGVTDEEEREGGGEREASCMLTSGAGDDFVSEEMYASLTGGSLLQQLLQAISTGDDVVYRLASDLLAGTDAEQSAASRRSEAQRVAAEVYEQACSLLGRLDSERGLPPSPLDQLGESDWSGDGWRDMLEAALLRFVGDCAERAARAQGPTYRQEIEQVRTLIDERYHLPLRLKELAESVYMNAHYLCTLFRSEVGMTIHQYVTRVRMERADLLLRSSHLKIYEIAEQTGFSSTQYFSSAFKKYYSVSPAEYREKFNAANDTR